MISVDSDLQHLHAGSQRETAAVCLGNALAGSAAAIIPLWVATLISSGSMPPTHVGWLASAELMLMAAGALAASAYAHLGNSRMIATAAAGIATVANLLATLPSACALIAGRSFSGLALGALQSLVTGVATRRGDAQRVLSLMQAALVLLASIILFSSSTLIGGFGVAGIFGMLAVVGGITTVAIRTGFPAVEIIPSAERTNSRSWPLAPLLAGVALGAMIMGVNVLWVYVVSIGKNCGISTHMLSLLLAGALPLSMLGPVGAHALGERVGLIYPLLAGQVVMAADAIVIVHAGTPGLFCTATVTLITLALFCAPYAIALIARLGPSSRVSSASPAIMMIGNAIAPAIGSSLAATERFGALAALAAAIISVSALLFSMAAGIGGKSHSGV